MKRKTKNVLVDSLLILFSFIIFSLSYIGCHIAIYADKATGFIIILCVSALILLETLLKLNKDLK